MKAKHYILDITGDQFDFTRDQDQITTEAALDGIYVIRTTMAPEQMDAAKVVATYKSLVRVRVARWPRRLEKLWEGSCSVVVLAAGFLVRALGSFGGRPGRKSGLRRPLPSA